MFSFEGFNLSIIEEQQDLAYATPRSKDWAKLRSDWLEQCPACFICGCNNHLQVHHIKPYHLFPELELDTGNLMTLCVHPYRMCHFIFGHLWNWKTYNAKIYDTMNFMWSLKKEAAL